MEEGILLDVREHVGVVTINRPSKLNALNDALTEQLDDAVAQALADTEVRAILIRAEGRAFCAGRDMSELGHRRFNESNYEHVRMAQRRNLSLMGSHKPVVAAVQGHAIGGGFEIALAADIRVASDDAKFRVPEIRYGLLPDTGASQVLSVLIGPARTKLLILTGRIMTARQAEQWGAVDIVTTRDALDETAFELAREIASGPPMALAMGKQLADHPWAERVRSGLGLELIAQTALFGTADYQEARAAVREKRVATYGGK